jgi:hypothetical protein
MIGLCPRLVLSEPAVARHSGGSRMDNVGDAAKAQTAVHQIELALETTRDGGNTASANDYEAELNKARRIFTQLSKH